MTAVLFVLNSLSYMSYILHGLFSIAKVGRWVCTRLGARQTSALSGCNKADRSPQHSEKTLWLVVNRVHTYMVLAWACMLRDYQNVFMITQNLLSRNTHNVHWKTGRDTFSLPNKAKLATYKIAPNKPTACSTCLLYHPDTLQHCNTAQSGSTRTARQSHSLYKNWQHIPVWLIELPSAW